MEEITKIEGNRGIPHANKKLRVAAYCRVSTKSSEQLLSLETQKAHYESHIKKNPGWECIGIYYDEGITGTKKEKRPGLLKMIRDCELGKIDYIVTKSISRFSRNTIDCLELTRKLLNLGITIYFEKENLNTGSMESELMLSILSGLAESESTSISENNRWSIQRRFRKGTFVVAYPPYGYKNSSGKMIIQEEQAKIVRRIFDEVLAGKPIYSIARDLQEEGIPTRKGGTWTSTTIRSILANEKYMGDALFQKTYTDTYFNRHYNNGELEQYYMKNHHEPIISREIFEKAEALVAQRGKENGVEKGSDKYQKRYPFTSKVICGECGTVFKRRIHNSGKKYVAWCCTLHIEDKEQCAMRFIRQSDLELAFITMMNKLIYSKKLLLKPLLASVQGRSTADGLLEIQEIEHRLEQNTDNIRTLINLMTKGYLEPAVFTEENNRLRKEAEALQKMKKNFAYGINGSMGKYEEVNRLFKFIEKAEMLTVFNAAFFEEYVDHVTVLTREEIAFNLKCGLSLKERV